MLATLPLISQTGYGRQKHSYRRQVLYGCRPQSRKGNEFSRHSRNIPLPELWSCVYEFVQRSRCQNGKLWQRCYTSYLFVGFLSFSPSLRSHLTWQYYIVQITVLGLLAVRETHNLMQSPTVCEQLRQLPLNMLNMHFLL